MRSETMSSGKDAPNSVFVTTGTEIILYRLKALVLVICMRPVIQRRFVSLEPDYKIYRDRRVRGEY